MKCPNDGVELVMSDRQGVEIDYCPTCRGVWLDRGELDKIIERSMGTQPAARNDDSGYGRANQGAQPYDHDSRGKNQNDDGHGRDGRKRRGLLGDIFDF